MVENTISENTISEDLLHSFARRVPSAHPRRIRGAVVRFAKQKAVRSFVLHRRSEPDKAGVIH
jgi:hypothetical protein